MKSYLLPEIQNLNLDMNIIQEDVKRDQSQIKSKMKRQLSHTFFTSLKCPRENLKGISEKCRGKDKINKIRSVRSKEK